MERIIVKDLEKRFKIGYKKYQTALQRIINSLSGREARRTIKALKRVSLKAKAGEIIGIIGQNGSGKSTLLRIIAKIYIQDNGTVSTKGKIISLIGLGEGLKYQLTMRENIYLVCSLFGFSYKQIKKNFNSIVRFAELEDFINTKLHQFSTGMIQRLVFSVVVHSNADIFLLDEAFSVGDVAFSNKCIIKIKQLVENGTTVILVSHNMWMIKKYCDNTIWMDQGIIVKQGNSKKIVNEYYKTSTK